MPSATFSVLISTVLKSGAAGGGVAGGAVGAWASDGWLSWVRGTRNSAIKSAVERVWRRAMSHLRCRDGRDARTEGPNHRTAGQPRSTRGQVVCIGGR